MEGYGQGTTVLSEGNPAPVALFLLQISRGNTSSCNCSCVAVGSIKGEMCDSCYFTVTRRTLVLSVCSLVQITQKMSSFLL